MRSMNLLVATALVAALVAGPVLAQDAMTAPAASTEAPAKPMKAHGKKHAKKHHHKKGAAATTTAPAAAQ